MASSEHLHAHLTLPVLGAREKQHVNCNSHFSISTSFFLLHAAVSYWSSLPQLSRRKRDSERKKWIVNGCWKNTHTHTHWLLFKIECKNLSKVLHHQNSSGCSLHTDFLEKMFISSRYVYSIFWRKYATTQAAVLSKLNIPFALTKWIWSDNNW